MIATAYPSFPGPYTYTPPPFVPRALTSLLNRASDLYWESRLGVHTRGGGGACPIKDGNGYGTLCYHSYFRIFDRLGLTSADVVVDLGAGKGRVTTVAALYPVKRVVGVEIDPDLCAIGQRNCERLRERRAPLSFVCQSATDFDFDDATVINLFNPFGAATMSAVLARLQQSLLKRPRVVRLIHGYPVLSPLLCAKPWLELYESWTPTPWSRLKFTIHFFRTKVNALA